MKSKDIKVGQRLTFWLTKKDEVFTLPVHQVLPNSQVKFVMSWKNSSQSPVYITVDRSHILGRA